jgi:phosphoglycerol transferase MdoB-like AlkP superfamily enzyme
MAKSLFITMLKHYVFWLVLFAFGRAVFLLWNFEELDGIPVGEILLSFIKAWYVDTAMASYLLIIPFVFLLLSAATGKLWFTRISDGLHLLLLIGFFLITFGELSIYDEWHSKLTYKALWFFSNPSEVIHTATWTQLISGTIATGVCTFFSFRFYRRKITLEELPESSWLQLGVFILLMPVLIFTGMRGGYYTIPVQLSDAYYSRYNILNLAALNSTFHLASSCIENLKAGEPYHFLPEDVAAKEFAALHAAGSDSTTRVLNTTRPNVVLVVLEGWSSDMVEALGGYPGITPGMTALCNEGISFSECYATGSLSDQGMAAVFSAFPAQPKTSIITQPNKYNKLPCINKVLRDAGYQTSFMFGGQLSYGNIRSYMYYNEFDRIIEGEDFAADVPQGKLGVHDQFLFDRQLAELTTAKQPFFASLFTLSTHGPFDFPQGRDLNFGGKEEDYVNSIYYADSCISDFISKAKKQPWYANTLFVFVSDHSHNTPKNYAFNEPAYRRIPLIFYGDVIRKEYRGKQFTTTASQTDLAATLLGQLSLDASPFHYSKNLFNPGAKRFAYYSFDEGFGMVHDHASLTWSVDGRGDYTARPVTSGETTADSLQLLRNGQAILQTISVDYWQY